MKGKKTGKIRDRKKFFLHRSTKEWISLNSDVKTIIEVKHTTR